MTAADQIVQSAKKVRLLCQWLFLLLPRVTVLSAVGIIRRNLVRSTGAAMSTTSWHIMTPLKAHLRSHPYPRPAGNHHIRNFTRMDLMNYGVRRRLRAPASGTAVLNARHYVR